ncbi:MAG TPA: tyrosine-type recombinase/integrase [Spirochaetota bacterium]|nr:tyrosine-type recombinase/integrase [Spirochaetota bacterium]
MYYGSRSKPYTIFKRNRFYYAQFRLPDGTRSVAKTTGQTSRGAAERWCIEYLNAGNIVRRENLTLVEYAKDFFNWGGAWATDKRVRGLRISKRQCHNLTYILNSHLLPRIGSMRLTNIDRAVIRDLRNDLFNRGYSGNTINKTLSALKAILEAAEDQSLIQFVPRIDRAAMNPKLKGILTLEEVRQLFSLEWRTEAKHCNPSRELYMGYVGNLLASSTGLRLGELQALTLSDIHLNEGYIYVRRSWDNFFGLNETTKTGKVRNIFFPVKTQIELSKLMQMNPEPDNPESFVFFSQKTPGKPAEPKVFTRSLYTAMRQIGINEQMRRERNITFHSWRHWFNSLLINARVPVHKIQSLTGHLTSAMTQHYYHVDDMGDVVQVVQDSLFKPIGYDEL